MGFHEDWGKFIDAVSPGTKEYRKQRERANEGPLSACFKNYQAESAQGEVSASTRARLTEMYRSFKTIWPAVEWNEVNKPKRVEVNKLLNKIGTELGE